MAKKAFSTIKKYKNKQKRQSYWKTNQKHIDI